MKIKKLFFAFIIFAASCGVGFSLSIPELTSPVIDNAKLLSNNQKNALDSELRSISEQTGTQIAVLTIKSLEGYSLESYSMAVAEKWKLGSKNRDDGVLVLVAFAEKKIRIEVGYGLEGDLTDTKCGLIIRNVMAPKFQSGNYGQGIVDAVRMIENIIGVGGDDVDTSILQSDKSNSSSTVAIIIFFMIYFFLTTGALAQKVPFLSWLPWAMLFRNSGKGGHNSSHGGGSFGGGSFGGGGFSGGGGGFGGGGASGSW